MNKTRTHLAVIAMVASMSLLAACSKADDKPAANPTPSPAVVTPAAPIVTPPPPPVVEITPAPVPAAGNSDKVEEFKDSAKKAADDIADKAKELKDDAVDAGKRAGDAIKEKADQADKAIQNKLGDGTATENPKIPADPKS